MIDLQNGGSHLNCQRKVLYETRKLQSLDILVPDGALNQLKLSTSISVSSTIWLSIGVRSEVSQS